MKLIPRISKNTWVIITSLFLIGTIYAIYFLVFVPSQRANLTEEKFRILNQYTQNVRHSFQDKVIIKFYKSKSVERFKKDHSIDDILKSAVIDQTEMLVEGQKFTEFYVLVSDSIDQIKTLYQSFPSTFNIPQVDSIKNLYKNPLSAGFTLDFKISEVDYLGFVQKAEFKYGVDSIKGSVPFIICGLVNAKDFNKRTRKVSSWVLTNALILSLILLLSMPLLKLHLMSPIERLYQSNVIWLGFCLIVGFCFLTLLSQSTISFYRTKGEVPTKLSTLSDTLSTGFIKEVKKAYKLIEQYDTTQLLFKGIKSQKCYGLNVKQPCVLNDSTDRVLEQVNIIRNDLYSDTISRINLTDLLTVKRDIDPEILPNDIYWIDTAGYLRVVLSTSQDTARMPKIAMNLKEREYFRKVVDNDLWKLSINSDTIYEFALQSIVSWADAAYETAISKKSTAEYLDTLGVDDMTSVNVTITMSSLMEPILPPGYGYSIIDEQGNTWFHSNKKKIHNENFLEEIDDRETLVAAMKSRASTSPITFAYSTVDHVAHVSPIKDLPLQLVVFYDMRYIKYPIIQALRITISLLALSFSLFLIHIIILYFFSRRSSRLKIKSFLFDWLSPKLENEYYYVLLRNTNISIVLMTILTVVVFAIFGSRIYVYNPGAIFFFVIFLPIIVLTYTYYVLKGNKKFLYVSIAYLLLLNLIFFLNNQVCSLISIVLQLLFISFIIFFPKIKIATDHFFNFARNGVYVQFLISWLVLTSVIPVFFLFNATYATEYWIWSKYNLLEIAKSVELRDDGHDQLSGELWGNGTFGRKKVFINQLKGSGLYHEFLLNDNKSENSDSCKIDTLSNYFAEFIIPLRANSPELTNNTRFLSPDSSKYNNWTWQMTNNPWLLSLYYSSGGNTDTYYNSDIYPFTENLFICICFWLVIFISVCLMYFIIKNAVSQIFAEKFRSFNFINLSVAHLKDKNRNKRILLIKMPLAGTDKVIRNYLKSRQKNKYIQFNFSNISNPLEVDKILGKMDSCRIFLFKNFEYMSNNHTVWKEKLKLIETITSIENAQIIITSQIHPLDVIRYYELMIQKSTGYAATLEMREKDEELWHAMAQWKKIFRGFIKIYDPIETNPAKVQSESYLKEHLEVTSVVQKPGANFADVSSEQVGGYKIPVDIRELIVEELKYGTYLPKLSRLIVDYCLENKVTDRDDVILRIQSLAQPYYYSLWSSLNKEERFLIFDLAKDGFVNLKNENGAKVLQEKGLFVFKDKLSLMNESFNNFILTIVSREMERDMERELKKKGSWNTIRIVLVLIVVGIIVFVVQGQQEVMNNLVTLFGAIIAGAGLFLRFADFNLFSSLEVPGKKDF